MTKSENPIPEKKASLEQRFKTIVKVETLNKKDTQSSEDIDLAQKRGKLDLLKKKLSNLDSDDGMPPSNSEVFWIEQKSNKYLAIPTLSPVGLKVAHSLG